VEALRATDAEALEGARALCRAEGILPALESSHALAVLGRLGARSVLLGLSGRGDKDLATYQAAMGA